MPICLLIGEDGLEQWAEYIRIQCFLLIYKGRTSSSRMYILTTATKNDIKQMQETLHKLKQHFTLLLWGSLKKTWLLWNRRYFSCKDKVPYYCETTDVSSAAGTMHRIVVHLKQCFWRDNMYSTVGIIQCWLAASFNPHVGLGKPS